jgi:hypothetical protein
VNHAISFDIILHSFVVEFESSQQTLFVLGDVYGGVVVGLQRSFISSPYKYDINDSFFS